MNGRGEAAAGRTPTAGDGRRSSPPAEVQCEPGPGGPSRITFSRACRKSSWPRCSTTWRRTERWKVKSNSSNADVDTAADQQRVQRVVVAVTAQVGIGGGPRGETGVGVGRGRGRRGPPR